MGKTNVYETIRRTEAEVKVKCNEISRACANVFIVNAGNMNNGKSSLFNSLLDREVFAVEDARTTQKCQQEKLDSYVYVIDTPGLNADNADDAEAYAAYEKANLIIFVHNLKNGELHEKEVDSIRRIASRMTQDYFRQHFVLALTFRESLKTDDDYAEISSKITDTLKKEFDCPSVKIFPVSNSRYKIAIGAKTPKKREKFLNGSGILELRDFIASHLDDWRRENLSFQRGKFNLAKEIATNTLKKESASVEADIAKIKEKYQEIMERAERKFDKASSLIKSKYNDLQLHNN